MKKESFLKELSSYLEVLLVEERNKIVKKYEQTIDNEIKKGKSEEEITSSFGSAFEIAKSELRAKGLNDSIISQSNIKGYFKQFLDAIDNFVNAFSKKTSKEIGKLIIDLLFIILVACLLKIPFIFVEDIIFMLSDAFSFSLTSLVAKLISIVLELIYVIIAIFAFISMFKKRFGDINTIKEKAKI